MYEEALAVLRLYRRHEATEARAIAAAHVGTLALEVDAILASYKGRRRRAGALAYKASEFGVEYARMKKVRGFVAPPSPVEHDAEPPCEVCAGHFGRVLWTRRPPQCRVCWLAGQIFWQVRFLLDSKPAGLVALNVSAVYLTIFSLLYGTHPADLPDDADELERSRADKVTALAAVAASRWRIHDLHLRRALGRLADERGISDTDLVKIDLCRPGIVLALAELEKPQRYRLGRQWTTGSPSDNLVRRTLRWIFNRAIREARLELRATADLLHRGDDSAILAIAPTIDRAAPEEDLESVVPAERLRELLAGAGPRQRELLETWLKQPDEPLAAVARAVGMAPNAAKQAVHRLRKRARRPAP